MRRAFVTAAGFALLLTTLTACATGTISGMPGQVQLPTFGRAGLKTEATPLKVFRREMAPPAAPRIQPLPNDGVLSQRKVTIAWTPSGDPAALAGYAHAVGREPVVALPETPNAMEPAAHLDLPEDGEWYFRVRAQDTWGNWSEAVTQPLVVDTVPLNVTNLKARTVSTNPTVHALPVSFTLGKPADVTVAFFPARGEEPVRTYALGVREGEVRVEWDGRTEAGELAPAGAYRAHVTAIDRAGNRKELAQERLSIIYKRIVVSLGRQALTAFDGDRVVLHSLITSGGPQTWTPAGTFEILTKQSPFTFRSPWPRGHPFWYEDSPASFAMLFAEGGFFLHDAPWRGNFGPGSNTRIGTPGGDFTGTHGCVNIPYAMAAQLFRWAELGVPVIVG